MKQIELFLLGFGMRMDGMGSNPGIMAAACFTSRSMMGPIAPVHPPTKNSERSVGMAVDVENEVDSNCPSLSERLLAAPEEASAFLIAAISFRIFACSEAMAVFANDTC